MNGWGASLSLALAAATLLGVVYLVARGRGMFGKREQPQRLLGKTVLFVGVESERPLALPSATVLSFDGQRYSASFALPVEFQGNTVSTVSFAARHKGFPASSVGRGGGVYINGYVSNSHAFTSGIALA